MFRIFQKIERLPEGRSPREVSPAQPFRPATREMEVPHHYLQDLTHYLLFCTASEFLRRAIFGSTISNFDSDFGVWSECWISVKFPSFHHSKGLGSNNTNTRFEISLVEKCVTIIRKYHLRFESVEGSQSSFKCWHRLSEICRALILDSLRHLSSSICNSLVSGDNLRKQSLLVAHVARINSFRKSTTKLFQNYTKFIFFKTTSQ